MTQPAIRIHDLGKQYQIGVKKQRYRTLRESLVSAAKSPWRRLKDLSGRESGANRVWALRDINLDIAEGDVIGVIGRNGAGKSTLLKILSRITEPTTGRVEIRGRVGSLLEVGTGFHPELTGRENIFLNGAILGMSRAEVRRKFDQIVDFSGVGEFLDTPVKRYSSGMHVRLAFAVAAHLEPEILVVDEVLAVGDAEFQAKCLGKMGDVASKGRTVLFVSHNMAVVESLCSRACLLDQGRLVAVGEVGEVLGQYLDSRSELSGDLDLAQHPGRTPGCRPIFRRLRIKDESGSPRPAVRIGGDLRFELEMHSPEPLTARSLVLRVTDFRGLTLFTCSTRNSLNHDVTVDGQGVAVCEVRDIRLIPGRYHLRIALKSGRQMIDEIQSGIDFEVLALQTESTGKIPTSKAGIIVPDVKWDLVNSSRSKLASAVN